MTEERPDISKAGFEWCPRYDDWHLPDEYTPRC